MCYFLDGFIFKGNSFFDKANPNFVFSFSVEPQRQGFKDKKTSEKRKVAQDGYRWGGLIGGGGGSGGGVMASP